MNGGADENEDVCRVLIVGPTPPPYHGVATFIRDVVGSPWHFPGMVIEPLDTSDRRDPSNLGRWDAGNLSLGFANLAEMASQLARRRHRLVYIPISQNIPAFLRDTLFILQARWYGARVVLHLHGGHFREFYEKQTPIWFRWIARFALNRAGAVAVLSDVFKPIFEGLVNSERIRVVENGVPDLFADADLEAMRSPERSRNTIIYMSTLARTKGIVDLIHAVALLRKTLSDVRLRIAGNGSEAETRSEALAFIERESLGGCVEFVGNVDGAAKREFLLSGDVFCLPTRYPYEGQPLTILEAMSAGLPVLSTRHGAIASTVTDGVTGMLLDPGCEVGKLAAALKSMLTDREKLVAMGRAGRARFLEKYTLERCHARLAEVFDAVARE